MLHASGPDAEVSGKTSAVARWRGLHGRRGKASQSARV